MADRESVLRWLSEKSYRVVPDDHMCRTIVERLIDEGRAAWLGVANRARATGEVIVGGRRDRHPRGPGDRSEPGDERDVVAGSQRRPVRPSSGRPRSTDHPCTCGHGGAQVLGSGNVIREGRVTCARRRANEADVVTGAPSRPRQHVESAQRVQPRPHRHLVVGKMRHVRG